MHRIFNSEAVQNAMKSQAKARFDNFMAGFLANEWVDMLVWAKTEQPHDTMEKVLAMLWEYIRKPMWKARNEVKHSKSSQTNQDELTQLTEQLLWYHRHTNEVLDY